MAPLLILLLPAAAGLMVVGCRLAGDGLRSAVLRGFVIFGTAVALSTETLSVFNRLDRLTLAVFWVGAVVCAGLIAFFRRHHSNPVTLKEPAQDDHGVQRAPQRASGSFPCLGARIRVLCAFVQGSRRKFGVLAHLNLVEKVCVLGIIATLAPVALAAILGAPNVADVLAYHMPRIVFWSQARSIAFFPTSYQQQILLQPFNEYLQLHTYVLAGGDRFVCVVQWFAFAGCVIGVSLIAERLGAGREGQLLTALACATIPMGILQASGAKNDLTLTFLLIATAYFGLVWMQRGRVSDLWTLSAAFALALFTKGTAYVIAPPLLAGTIVSAGFVRRRRLAAMILPVIAATLVINGPQYIRCYRYGDSPVGPSSAYADGYGRFANDKTGVPVILSNAVRNIGLHFRELPGTTRFVYMIHRALGIDPADPATTWPGTRFGPDPDCEHGEACAPSTIHVILLLMATPVVCWLWIRGIDRRLFFYLAGIVASFVLFCALLRWQPWNSRLHLGFLIPGAVVIGMLLSRIPSAAVKIMLCAVLLIPAQLFVYRSNQHPLVSRTKSVLINRRENQLFSDAEGIDESTYSNAADYVRRTGCTKVGIDDSFGKTGSGVRLAPVEYPMLALLKERIPGVRFIHVGVHNRSAQYTKDMPFTTPCAVVCLRCAGDPEKSAQYRSAGERAVFGPVVVFSRLADSGAPPDIVLLSR